MLPRVARLRGNCTERPGRRFLFGCAAACAQGRDRVARGPAYAVWLDDENS